jgi:hypothetical protein
MLLDHAKPRKPYCQKALFADNPHATVAPAKPFLLNCSQSLFQNSPSFLEPLRIDC